MALAYRPLFELASGGMGTVTLALRRESTFERLYAVKRLRPHVAEDPEMREMFLAEAKVAGLIRHPNVVSVLDVGADTQGPFLVMEWVDGISLATFLRAALRHGPVPVPYCLEIAAQVARGLDAAHELETHTGESLRLVHRDVSPQNVLVGFDGLVRVTDFGISKVLGAGRTTGQGILKGKMGYLSPEQLRFQSLDRRSDLFSLGVVIFEMLSGKRLYSGKAPESVAGRILRDPPPSIGEYRRDAPPSLEELLFELLAKQPEDRPATAADVAARLDAIAMECFDDELTSLKDFSRDLFQEQRESMRKSIASSMQSPGLNDGATEPVPVKSPPRRGWLLGGAAAVILLAAVIGAAIFVSSNNSRPDVPEVAPAPEVAASPPPAEPVGVMEVEPEPEVTDPEPAPSKMRARRRRGRSRMGPRMTAQMAGPRIPEVGEGGWNAI